jgi:hypothetical protein
VTPRSNIPARWQSWAVFFGIAVLFSLFVWLISVGSLIAGDCNPTLDDAAFAACDVAVGHLQRGLLWSIMAIPLATAVEWRWHWNGSAFLVVAIVLIIAIVRLTYS